jgi:glycosyltransferase involved in cell wall biosynthesis
MDDHEYSDRDPEELAALRDSFRAPGGPRNYVAAAAPGWDVRGLWHCFDSGSRSGYAAHAVALHWALSNGLKVPTQLVPHRSLDVDIERFPDDRYDMLFDWHKNAVGIPELMIVSFPPDTAVEQVGVHGKIIPYCAFEGDRISDVCAQLCNGNGFESIWVVSEFVRDAFILGGVDPGRVRTVTPLLCGGPYPMPALEPLVEAAHAKQAANEPFRFGVMGTWHSRKGFHQLVEAYWSEFDRQENVELLIRTSNFGRRRTIKEFQEMVTAEMKQIAASMGRPNWPEDKSMAKIKLLTGTSLTDGEVIEWLSTLDCYVNPSYGEGLGIPHHWAKACNVPLVTSDWGAVGQLATNYGGDVVFESEPAKVDSEITRISFMFDRGTLWGSYNTEQLAVSMRQTFEEGRRLQLHESAPAMRQDFGPDAASKSVTDALAALNIAFE